MTFDITPIISAVFALIATIITCMVIPWIKSKTSAEQQAMIKYWITVAVHAAEMLFKGETGEKKLQYAMTQVESFLAQHKLIIDRDILRTMIEAAVLEIKTNGQELSKDGSIKSII